MTCCKSTRNCTVDWIRKNNYSILTVADTSLQESHQGFANTDQHNLRESSNGGNRSPDSSSTASDNEERNEEYSDDNVVSFYDGCVMTTSQFKDIVDSMKIPEECVLTVPHLFSGPLDKFSHVMKSFPSSVNSDEGFVQLPSGLLVPYHCYDYITFMHQSGSGSEPSGTLLSTGEYIDPTTVANIVASATTPHQNFIITTNNEVVPYEIYSTYIDSLSLDDKKLIKVLVRNLKVPIPYLIFKEIYDKYTSESGYNESSEDKVKLIGSDTEITLKEFLSVISNLYVLNQATVTLPSKSTMSLTSFIQLSRILGEEYTKHCLVNIPNTDYSIPFLVFKEIYSTYFNKNSPNLSKDTNVNLKLSVSDEYPHSSDVEVFNLDRDITIENQSSPSKSCRNTRHNTEQRTPNEKEVQFVPDKQHTYSEFRNNC
ncbi:hypothetical protein J6590_070378 [Homalodisca vitripennis]|nr:hypothetical protein J6590_070378 [Homalodisca vitripennis]